MTTLRDEAEALDVVSRAMARRLGPSRSELTLTNGVVLEFRPVSPVLTISIQNELNTKLPKPPRVWLEEKGREEENPNDPDYLAALERHQYLADIAMGDALTYAGVEVKHVPEGLYRPEQDEWLQDSRIVVARANGFDFDPADPIKRKVVWMRLYAIENYVDTRLWDEVQTDLVGMREEEVQEALSGFRSLPERPTDNGSAPTQADTNGNTSNRATRRSRSRVRGA